MDMEVSRKEGETHIVDMYENVSLLDQSSHLKRIKLSSLYLTKNRSGQSLLIVKFDNNTVWMPKWDEELTFLWCYAFLTELTNWLTKEPDQKKPRRYDPEKNLIEPLLRFINDEIGVWKLNLMRSPIAEGVRKIK